MLESEERLAKQVGARAWTRRLRGEKLPVAPGAGHTLEKPDHMARDMCQTTAGGNVPTFHHTEAIPLRQAARQAPVVMLASVIHGGTTILGMTLLPNGICVPKFCPPGEHFEGGRCVRDDCPRGEVRLVPNGACVKISVFCRQGEVFREGRLVATLGQGTSVGEMAYLAPNPDLRRHSTDIKVRDECTTISFTPEALGQLSPECQHRFDRGFIRVLVRRLHAAHEALAHPRRIL